MRRLDLALLGVLSLLMVAALVFVSWRALDSAERLLLPELNRKAEVVGRSVGDLLSEAVDYGIPIASVVGARPVLEDSLADNPEFSTVSILLADGSVLASVSNPEQPLGSAPIVIAVPVEAEEERVAQVMVQIPGAVVERTIRNIWLDVAVVLLASILVTFEMLVLVFSADAGRALRGLGQRLVAISRGDLRRHASVEAGGLFGKAAEDLDQRIAGLAERQAALKARAQQLKQHALSARLGDLEARFRIGQVRDEPPPKLAALRAPLFLFFFAEELTRPFLPAFTASLVSPIEGLSRELVISLPIVLFMAIVAILQPVLNGPTERLGRGRALRIGAVLAVIGFTGAAFGTDLLQFLLFRAMTAIGYALVFVSAQGAIIDVTERQNRARGLATLVGAIFVAALCGPPVGGILADRLGERETFMVSAVLALLAIVAARFAMPNEPKRDRLAGSSPPSLSAFFAILRTPALAALLVGCALPAKLILAALVFFLVPLTMADEGFDQAAIGRVLTLYALAMIVLVPLVSRISDRLGRQPNFVLLGAFLSATSVAHPLIWEAPWGEAAMVFQLGIAQALSITPQSALVGELGRRYLPHISEGMVYGVFRLVERSGNAIGPALAAFFLGAYGLQVALIAVGLVSALGALAYLAALGLSRSTRERRDDQ
ncbi:MAG: MFS transporter [Pseudomonadota bacterium]